MESLHFEAAVTPARTVSLHELLYEQYLVKNPPKNQKDLNHTIKSGNLFMEMFPNISTAEMSADHLVIFRNNIVERVSEKNGQTYSTQYCNKLVGRLRAVFKWAQVPTRPTDRQVRSRRRFPEVQGW